MHLHLFTYDFFLKTFFHRIIPKNLQLSTIFILTVLFAGNLLAQPAVEWDKVQPLSPDFGPYPRIVYPTSDGGMIVGLYPVNSAGSKYFILKLDSKGNKEWEKTFEGNNSGELKSVIQTSDGGYLIGGKSSSDAVGDKSDPAFSNNFGNCTGFHSHYC